MQEKVDERNHEIEYGDKKKSGNISLYEACKGMIDDWESGVPRELVKDIKPVDCDKWRDEVNRMKSRIGKLLSDSSKQRAYALIDDSRGDTIACLDDFSNEPIV